MTARTARLRSLRSIHEKCYERGVEQKFVLRWVLQGLIGQLMEVPVERRFSLEGAPRHVHTVGAMVAPLF